VTGDSSLSLRSASGRKRNAPKKKTKKAGGELERGFMSNHSLNFAVLAGEERPQGGKKWEATINERKKSHKNSSYSFAQRHKRLRKGKGG